MAWAWVGSRACSASMKAASPPAFWASEMMCRARVVLPLDSGPKISTMRPLGTPPTPRARSRARAPVGMEATFGRSSSPMRMIEPFPNCRSIWETAASIALLLSNASSNADVRRLIGIVSSPSILERLLHLTSQKTLNEFFVRLGQNHFICIKTEIRPSRAISPHPLQRLPAESLRLILLLLRKLADGEVRLLLAGALATEAYAQDLHLRGTGARALRPASHLAGLLLRLDQGNSDPRGPRSPL